MQGSSKPFSRDLQLEPPADEEPSKTVLHHPARTHTSQEHLYMYTHFLLNLLLLSLYATTGLTARVPP